MLETESSQAARKQLIETIQSAISERRGFSFIRLGDGEGAFLRQYDQSKIKDQNMYFQTWYGRNCEGDEAGQFENLIDKAISDADVIGVPNLLRLVEDFSSQPGFKKRTIDSIYSRLSTASVGVQYTSAFSHIDLLQHQGWETILSMVPTVSVISGHDQQELLKTLDQSFGVEVDAFYAIPSEHKFRDRVGSSSALDHYQDCFTNMVQHLEQHSLKGRVFLVGAGFLGKYYASVIKRSGGVALDVGSAFDYMQNIKTRRHDLM